MVTIDTGLDHMGTASEFIHVALLLNHLRNGASLM